MGVALRVYFLTFFAVFVPLWTPLGRQRGPFGTPGGVKKVNKLGPDGSRNTHGIQCGPQGRPGEAQESLLSGFGRDLEWIWVCIGVVI